MSLTNGNGAAPTLGEDLRNRLGDMGSDPGALGDLLDSDLLDSLEAGREEREQVRSFPECEDACFIYRDPDTDTLELHQDELCKADHTGDLEAERLPLARVIAARRETLADPLTPNLISPGEAARFADLPDGGGAVMAGRLLGTGDVRKRAAAVMIAHGYRQIDVAACFGVTPRTVRNWLADEDVQEAIRAEAAATLDAIRSDLRTAHMYAARYLRSRLTPERNGTRLTWSDRPGCDRLALALVGRRDPWG